ncbi:MAG: hypothetical protein E7021_00910 [Alphaproteobacteria bacterium]|nr:hypothetical protein [Alphaproteobacteria bacterium]
MPNTTLYRGVSSIGIEDILENGIHPYKTKYDEARAILSKYINPEILTDEFLEQNQDNIGHSFGNLGFRFRQFQKDGGVFCTIMEQYSDEEYRSHDLDPESQREFDKQTRLSAINGAMEYAYRTAKSFPEYEWYIVDDLNSLGNQNLLELEEQIETAYAAGKLNGEALEAQYKRLECRKKILENIKPEYKDKNNNVRIDSPKGSYPIVLQINGNDRNFSYQNGGEVRLVGDLMPEDITGVAFAPEKMDELPIFVSKKEFLKQLEQRKEKDRTQTKTPNQDQKQAFSSTSQLKDILEKGAQLGKEMAKKNTFAQKVLSDVQRDI